VIAVVGASGAVGTEALSILSDRGYPPGSVRCFGSARSAGSVAPFGAHRLTIENLDALPKTDADYALLCADAETARSVRDRLRGMPTVIIDNSSAFRMDKDVPLVIPEINSDLISHETSVIANPNCSTIMMLCAIEPIRRAYKINGVSVTTYQAVSGAGRRGIQELHSQTRAFLDGESISPEVFPHTCAFNVFEHESELDPVSGYNGEELKMIRETRKIWNCPTFPLLPTCVRVPVERTHAQSIIIEIAEHTNIEDIRSCYANSSLRLSEPGHALTPREITGTDSVAIGRIRVDHTSDATRVVLWACCDQIRKGAALNAIQIMETVEALNRDVVYIESKKSTRLGKACAEEQNQKVLA
jgi:aspartate-semialdehyde dehydrogenase